jgi:phytoene synthase
MTALLDADRRLALTYVPARKRDALEALWRLDVTLASVLATGKEPMISRIRLAWWREALENLDRQNAPGEPVLQAVAKCLLPAGLGGRTLAQMERGWAVLASPKPLTSEELRSYARDRGALLFEFSARLLAEDAPFLADAGARWALVDLARHSGEPDSSAAKALAATLGPDGRWPANLRPLGMLSALAERDLRWSGGGWEVQGSPGRMWRMLRHRLGGR